MNMSVYSRNAAPPTPHVGNGAAGTSTQAQAPMCKPAHADAALRCQL